jgi:mono/diheme cytochrome c family protein
LGAGCTVDDSPRALYQNHCAACHPGLNKGAGPALRPTALSDDEIRAKIRGSPRGTMPVFGPEKLSDAQVADIVRFIREGG